jgi:hypothetical protein
VEFDTLGRVELTFSWGAGRRGTSQGRAEALDISAKYSRQKMLYAIDLECFVGRKMGSLGQKMP